MKIFADKKASRLFLSMLEALPEGERAGFTAQVKELFWKKQNSEDGEYSQFKVTSDDLYEIANCFV